MQAFAPGDTLKDPTSSPRKPSPKRRTAPTAPPEPETVDLYAAFHGLADAVIITDAELEAPGPRILYVNPAFERLTGYSSAEAIGRSPRFMQGAATDRDTLESIRDALRAGRTATATVENYSRDGSRYWTELRIEPIRNKRRRVEQFIALQRDVTERKRLEDEARHRANHDALTGLANRAQFLERLEHTLAEAKRYGHRVGVAMFDLDRFKRINDTLGHGVGDTVLRQVAKRLNGSVRASDLAARFGGDEFAVLLTEPRSPAEAVRIMQRSAAGIAKPIPHDERGLSVTASVGISVYPDDAPDAATLLHHADLAMYASKAKGRDSVRLFSSSLSRQADQQNDLERRLRLAVKRGLLHLHFQPIHDAKTGALESLEALCRWTDDRLGSVSPDVFIPLAEEIGVIQELGTWVLWEACRRGATLQPPGGTLRISVNVAPSQFNEPDLVGHVQRALRTSGLPAGALRLEITEQTLVADLETCLRHLQTLRGMGVEVAVDDFGIGYSNLVQLLNLPVDFVKLDRTLTREVGSSAKASSLVGGIVQLAHTLGFRVVCEGVEAEAARHELVRLGCDCLQGFLLSVPLPFDEVLPYAARPHRAT